MTDFKNLSMMEAAERILSENKTPMTFLELFRSLAEAQELTDAERADRISQFYADFIVSAKFIYMGDDQWDLKYRQSIDLWDKDGAYYQEFPDFAEGEEEEEVEFEADEEEEEEEEAEFEADEEDLEAEETEADEEGEFELVPEEEELPAEEEEFDDAKYNEYMDDYEDMYDEE